MGGAMKDEVTSILSAVEQGDPQAAERLLPLIYDELRALAARKLEHEKPGQTLQATALVHEAYIRLVDTEKVQHWNSRGHFFAAAAEAMRRILIEKARQKSTRRRGQGSARSELRDDDLVASPLGDELLDLDEALTRFTAIDAECRRGGEAATLRRNERGRDRRDSANLPADGEAELGPGPRLAGAGAGRIQAVARRPLVVAEEFWPLLSPFLALPHRTAAERSQWGGMRTQARAGPSSEPGTS